MEFYKVIDRNGLLRIEDAEGARISVRTEGKRARLLSVYVPKAMRRKGIGSVLLSMAEAEGASRGMKSLETAFPDKMTDVMRFLNARGYRLEKGPHLLAFDRKELLRSPVIAENIMQVIPGTDFRSLQEAGPEDFEALYRIINHLRIPLSWDDLCTYEKPLSGVVYDETGRGRTVLLSRLSGKELNIDLIGSMPGSDPKYVMAALSNLLKNLVEGYGRNAVTKVTGIPSDQAARQFAMKCAGSGISSEKHCDTCYASKTLPSDPPETEEQPEEALTEGTEILWHQEVFHIPNQANIGWKVCWMKHEELF